MTCITNYPTKKAFKEAINEDASEVLIEDPSIFNPFLGSAKELLEKQNSFVVTNHPKRSWFAQVTLTSGDKIVVK